MLSFNELMQTESNKIVLRLLSEAVKNNLSLMVRDILGCETSWNDNKPMSALLMKFRKLLAKERNLYQQTIILNEMIVLRMNNLRITNNQLRDPVGRLHELAVCDLVTALEEGKNDRVWFTQSRDGKFTLQDIDKYKAFLEEIFRELLPPALRTEQAAEQYRVQLIARHKSVRKEIDNQHQLIADVQQRELNSRHDQKSFYLKIVREYLRDYQETVAGFDNVDILAENVIAQLFAQADPCMLNDVDDVTIFRLIIHACANPAPLVKLPVVDILVWMFELAIHSMHRDNPAKVFDDLDNSSCILDDLVALPEWHIILSALRIELREDQLLKNRAPLKTTILHKLAELGRFDFLLDLKNQNAELNWLEKDCNDKTVWDVMKANVTQYIQYHHMPYQQINSLTLQRPQREAIVTAKALLKYIAIWLEGQRKLLKAEKSREAFVKEELLLVSHAQRDVNALLHATENPSFFTRFLKHLPFAKEARPTDITKMNVALFDSAIRGNEIGLYDDLRHLLTPEMQARSPKAFSEALDQIRGKMQVDKLYSRGVVEEVLRRYEADLLAAKADADAAQIKLRRAEEDAQINRVLVENVHAENQQNLIKIAALERQLAQANGSRGNTPRFFPSAPDEPIQDDNQTTQQSLMHE